jgi:hypothetical protein
VENGLPRGSRLHSTQPIMCPAGGKRFCYVDLQIHGIRRVAHPHSCGHRTWRTTAASSGPTYASSRCATPERMCQTAFKCGDLKPSGLCDSPYTEVHHSRYMTSSLAERPRNCLHAGPPHQLGPGAQAGPARQLHRPRAACAALHRHRPRLPCRPSGTACFVTMQERAHPA